MDKNKINAEIHVISGSVEIAPNIGLADGICDIVSSGSTLFKNGLKETHVILRSEAVLAKSKEPRSRKRGDPITTSIPDSGSLESKKHKIHIDECTKRKHREGKRHTARVKKSNNFAFG